jgi:hypothetical protein
MIVASFTPSYSLLAYLCQFLGTVLDYLLFQHISHVKKMLSLKVIRFSHRHNLKIINLEAVTLQ